MARTSPETIEKINELYFILGVKSQVAKQLGISPATVSKYIDPNYQPKAQINLSDISDYNINLNLADFTKDWCDVLQMSQEEKDEIEKFRKELN